MTISRGFLSLLMEEGARCSFGGKLLTFGRQKIEFKFSEFRSLVTRYGASVPSHHDMPADDEALFGFLGFDLVHSLDYSNFEGATVTFDLNRIDLPVELIGQYDVVLDGGTSEHVFRIENALQNALALTKIGGRVVFFTPSSNHMEHGFHMPSPMFFYEYFCVNLVDVEVLYVIRYFPYSPRRLWEAYAYEPGQWSDIQSGGLDDAAYFTFVIGRKNERSTVGCVPQQRSYLDIWEKNQVASSPSLQVPPFSSPFRERLKTQLAFSPLAYRAALKGERLLKSIRARVTGMPAGLQNKRLIARH
jgi:hypothetical protein